MSKVFWGSAAHPMLSVMVVAGGVLLPDGNATDDVALVFEDDDVHAIQGTVPELRSVLARWSQGLDTVERAQAATAEIRAQQDRERRGVELRWVPAGADCIGVHRHGDPTWRPGTGEGGHEHLIEVPVGPQPERSLHAVGNAVDMQARPLKAVPDGWSFDDVKSEVLGYHAPGEATRNGIPDYSLAAAAYPSFAAYLESENPVVWTTAQMQADFEVLGFHSGYSVVKRRADGVVGSLKFTHRPRYYYDWQEDKR